MTNIASRARTADYRLFFGLCAVLFITVLVPILLTGRPCNDDLARSVLGSYGWVDNGRYLSNILMRALELGASRATDIAPVPQLLAILALGFAGVLLVRRFEIASVPLGILVTLPLGMQPFFLQNFSYRFDSVTMAGALLCSVAAISARDRSWRNGLSGTIALLAAFNLYQPAFNVFLVLAVFELAFGIAQGLPDRDIARTAGFRASQALIAAVVYKLLFTAGIKDWVADHGETIQSFDALPASLWALLRYVRDTLGGRLASIFLVLTILAALPAIVIGIKFSWREQSMRAAMWRSIFLALWPAFGLIASIGPMLLLVAPVFAPRVFPAIGALISASLISAAYAGQRSGRLRPVPYALGGAFLIVSAITAGAYSNAAAEQMKFEDTIASTLQDDLAQLKSNAPLSSYVILGSAGYAPATQHAIAQFPIVGRLLESYLAQDTFFTRSYLQHFRQPLKLIDSSALSDSQRRSAVDSCAPSVLTRSAYRVRVLDNIAIVDFRDAAGCRR